MMGSWWRRRSRVGTIDTSEAVGREPRRKGPPAEVRCWSRAVRAPPKLERRCGVVWYVGAMC